MPNAEQQGEVEEEGRAEEEEETEEEEGEITARKSGNVIFASVTTKSGLTVAALALPTPGTSAPTRTQ